MIFSIQQCAYATFWHDFVIRIKTILQKYFEDQNIIPGKPGCPGDPGNPVDPVRPGLPGFPGNPTDPVCPLCPGEPGWPSLPGNPTNQNNLVIILYWKRLHVKINWKEKKIVFHSK